MAKKNKLNVANGSYFNGRLLNLIGTELLMVLVIVIMTAIGALIACFNIVGQGGPWYEDIKNPLNLILVILGLVIAAIGVCWAEIIFLKWETKHTVISGYQLKFKSSALNLFFNLVKWAFLSVITLTIYAWWLPIKVRKWRAKHTVAAPVESEYGYAAPQITYYTVD